MDVQDAVAMTEWDDDFAPRSSVRHGMPEPGEVLLREAGGRPRVVLAAAQWPRVIQRRPSAAPVRLLAPLTFMARVVGVLSAVAVFGLSAACSPGINAAIGIGYDARGRLVDAVRVCDGNVVRAHLAPEQPDDAADLGVWKRTPPLTGTESWPLQAEESGRWRSEGRVLPGLAPDKEYLFWSEDRNGSHTSHDVVFRGRDLVRLKPGELLVLHDTGSTDAQGYPTPRLVTIRLDRMKDETC